MRPLCLLACLALGAGACGSAERREEPAPPSGPLTEAECTELLDHVLDLQLDRWRAERPPEAIPDPEQLAALRRNFKESEMERCLAMPRAGYRCAMEALRVEEVQACARERP